MEFCLYFKSNNIFKLYFFTLQIILMTIVVSFMAGTAFYIWKTTPPGDPVDNSVVGFTAADVDYYME